MGRNCVFSSTCVVCLLSGHCVSYECLSLCTLVCLKMKYLFNVFGDTIFQSTDWFQCSLCSTIVCSSSSSADRLYYGLVFFRSRLFFLQFLLFLLLMVGPHFSFPYLTLCPITAWTDRSLYPLSSIFCNNSFLFDVVSFLRFSYCVTMVVLILGIIQALIYKNMSPVHYFFGGPS